jgi:hypothetical protein
MPGEGLASYLLRVAAGNGYPGITSLLRAIGRQSNRPLAETLLHLRVDSFALRDLGRMTVGNRDHLRDLLAEALPPLPDPTEAIFFADCRIDRDALVLGASPICPACLASGGFALADWELAPVTVCTAHHTLLRDSCERCTSPLSWQRPSLELCGRCCADLRQQGAPSITEECVIAVTDNFSALAPFRLIDSNRKTRTVFWDEMFRVLKALLLPDSKWALGEWPKTLVSTLSVQCRHHAVKALASCRVGNAYDLSRLRWKSDRALAALGAIPRAFFKEEFARRFLTGEAGLSGESADVLSGGDVIPQEPAAFESVRPWPPALRTYDDVAGFLGVSKATVVALVRNGRLAPPNADDDGFDADAVLSASRFLRELVDLSQLTELAGIEAPASALTPYGMLPRWNGIDLGDHRIDLDRVVEIHRHLMARWHGSSVPAERIPLIQVVQNSDRPFEVLMAYVQRIAVGEIDRISWDPPYRWADIKIEGDKSRAP